jgi:hypothetical protein
MQKPTATPGPWTLKWKGTYGDNMTITGKSERYGQSTGEVLIAKMENHRLGSADRVPPVEIQTANARLIAASPFLLQALEELLECTELNLDEMEESTVDAIATARDAINSAIGNA